MECCKRELIDDTYFIRIAGPLSVNSRVSTKSNCGQIQSDEGGCVVVRNMYRPCDLAQFRASKLDLHT